MRLFICLFLQFTCAAFAAPFNTALWVSGTPEGGSGPDVIVYLAPLASANGAAVVVCPGGGYSGLVTTEEGTEVAQWLNTKGIAGIVLPYRLQHHPVPLEDGLRAIRLVRAKAVEWGLDTAKIGIMGFSAGGHLASTVGTHFTDSIYAATDTIDRYSNRPSFQILIYPVISFWPPLVHTGSMESLLGYNPSDSLRTYLSNEMQVKPSTPPAFLAHALDDDLVPCGNSQAFHDSCVSKGVQAELHLYPHGGHGFFPYDSTISMWARDGISWLTRLGIVPDSGTGLGMASGKQEGLRVKVFPNPFNPAVAITLDGLGTNGSACVEIFNMQGKLMKQFDVRGTTHVARVAWDGSSQNGSMCASGTYVIKVHDGAGIYSYKAALMR